MTEFSIRAKHLAKQYNLGETRSVFGRIPGLRRFGSGGAAPASVASFWALNDVSFDVKEGEAVGVIGRNGAGKSTLLKVLSRITQPTRGEAEIHGRLASLLEVGTGFHPELTGRQNIYMNGSILGMRRSEIAKSFDEIVAFADIARFVDTPVKRYSSGMYVRLAFSVAAHLEPEILIIDEVLAVGDVQFQKKCLGKMDDVRRSGRTVLFVSHNMTAVRALTSRCVLLADGQVEFDGATDRAIELYSKSAGADFEQGADLSRWPRVNLNLTRAVNLQSVRFADGASFFQPDQPLELEITVQATEAVDAMRARGTIFDAEGVPVGSFFSSQHEPMRAGERKTFGLRLEGLRLGPGRYFFLLGLVHGNELTGHIDHDAISDVLPFEVAGLKGEGGTLGTWHRSWGTVRFDPAHMWNLPERVKVEPVG